MANAKVFPLFVCFYSILIFVLATALGPVCNCRNYHCPEFPDNCTGPNHEIARGGYCNCCKVCVTLLGEYTYKL